MTTAAVFHHIDISVAPECDPDILAAAPLLVTDDAGVTYLQLQGGAPLGPDDAGITNTFRVLERTDLIGAHITIALVQYSKSTGVYIFPTPEQETAPVVPPSGLDHLRENLPSLVDVLVEANALHDVLMQTGADAILEAHAPALMRAAWELRNKNQTPGTDRMEIFGTMLALRCMLLHPEALQVAAQRLHDRMCELLGEEDQEMIALLKVDG